MQRRSAASREAETEDQTQQRQVGIRQLMVTGRARRTQARVTEKIGTKTADILNGTLHVPELHDSPDSIGEMIHVCRHCGAYKFKQESPSSCCLEGKIVLPPFPEPPQAVKDLWFGETPDAKLFKMNSRVFNNAVSLSSLSVRERPEGPETPLNSNYAPSVIFHGRVIQRMGPLQAEADAQPCFAQIYVIDQSLETTIRFANMTLPRHMSQPDKERMRRILETIQQEIHQRNPFVREFKQVMDIPEQDITEGKVIISAKA